MTLTDQLADALREVKEWIQNWTPNFVYDDEWPATVKKADAALAAYEARPAASDDVEAVARALCNLGSKEQDGDPCSCKIDGSTCFAMTLFEDAARAAIAAMGERDGWMPIETAPKDGTRILVAAKHHGEWFVFEARWASSHSAWLHVDETSLAGKVDRGDFWRPLPTPPASKG